MGQKFREKFSSHAQQVETFVALALPVLGEQLVAQARLYCVVYGKCQ